MSHAVDRGAEQTEPSAPPRGWRPARRAVVSVLLILHMTAACTAPWAAVWNSRLARVFWIPARYYLDATFLDHGYNFFSPDPGYRSHLVKYELEMPDGTLREGVFPNLQQHRPRLWYHRHFMLSSQLARFYVPQEVEQQAREEWERAEIEENRARLSTVARGYARHLAYAHGAKRVFLYLREHRVPTPEEVQHGAKLSDPDMYRDLHLGTWTRDELLKDAA